MAYVSRIWAGTRTTWKRTLAKVRDAFRTNAPSAARMTPEPDVAAIGHDMKNLLHVLGTGLENLRQHLPVEVEGEIRSEIDDMQEAVAQLKRLTRAIVRVERGRTEAPVDLAELARTCARMVRSIAERSGGEVLVHAEGPCCVPMDRQELERIVLNLMMNAVDATGGRGRIEVTVERVGDRASLRVRDDGPGVPSELQERVFDPLFTTKARGSGLGLSIVRDLVTQHGGEVRIESTAPAGADFLVRLPSLPPPPVEA